MVSVIIPAYNRENTIVQSAKSVLDQTYKDLELIIVDDCSSDGTKSIVLSLAAEDDRVHYFRHEKNQGACIARNTGIEAAKGDYIAFQDSDDIWHLDKLEKQMNSIIKSNADVVFCKYNRLLDGKLVEIGPSQYTEGFLDPVVNLFSIGTQTLLGKREVFEEFRFDSDLPRFQELELLIRITKKYKLYCLDDPLVEYNAGITGSIGVNPEKAFTAINIILKKHSDILTRMPELGKSFAHILLKDVSYAEKKHGIKKTDIYRLILKCDNSMKCKIKLILRIIGLYDLVMEKRRKTDAKNYAKI